MSAPAPSSRRRWALLAFAFACLLTLGLWWWAQPRPSPEKPERVVTARPVSRPEVSSPKESPPPARTPPAQSPRALERERLDDLGYVGAEDVSVLWHGHVDNGAGLPRGTVRVRGCGGYALVDDEGYYELTGDPGPCELRAERRDGLLTALGEPKSVQAKPGSEVVVDLVVSAHAAAGMGIGYAATESGMLVTRVHPGGGAEQAGLQPGDLILNIDGEPTADMSAEEFMEWGVGLSGTEVQLQVLQNGMPRTLVIRRGFIAEEAEEP